MRKEPTRTVCKIGAATTDWSGTVADDQGFPAMGGAAWIRLGNVKRYSVDNWVIGQVHRIGKTLAVQSLDQRPHLDCAVIVFQRYMDAGLEDAVTAARNNGQIIVNDIDDWFWGLHPKNSAHKLTDPKYSPKANIAHYRKILLASDVIVVSTPFLAARVIEWGAQRVEIIPNGVDIKIYPQRRHTDRPPVIGWAGSVASRSGDLTILRKPFATLPDTIAFHHTGDDHNAPSFASETGIHPKRVSTLPLLAPHEYPYGLPFDIGVVPLVDIDFNRAKSNIKGLEYAAAGIPFVASPLPEYVWLAEDHGIGRLAKTSRDWTKQLAALLDYDTRRAEAARQHEAVKALSARHQARAWDSLIWSLL